MVSQHCRWFEFESADTLKPLDASGQNSATDFRGGVLVETDAACGTAWGFWRDAEAQRIGSVHPKSLETAPLLTFARRSCAVPEELTARRSTLARSANQQLTFAAAGPLMEDGKTELARLFLYLLTRGEHDLPEV